MLSTNGAWPRIEFVEHRLDNGLRVILSEDHLASVVAVNLWYNVGSRHEARGKTGLAHLFEHMMFQGSRHVDKAEHFRLISSVGGTLNGSTWVDRTNYYETLPSHHLDLALWLEADRLGGLLDALGQETLDNQREVVKNERRQGSDNRPYGSAIERLQAAVFPEGHPYHHRTIGSMEDLDAASLDDVRTFFRTYYAPNNAVLSIVGDFEPQSVRASVERFFGGIPSNPNIPPAPDVPIPAKIGRQVLEEVLDRVPLGRIYLGFRCPPLGTRAFDALMMASVVLARGKGSRLYSILVRDRQLAQDFVFGPFEWVGGSSMVVGWATARPEVALETLEAALHEVVGGLAGGKIDEEELTRARAIVEKDELGRLQPVEERADRLSMYATLFDDPEKANERLPTLFGVTADEIREAVGEFFTPDNRVVLSFMPAPLGETA
ncbi:MAG: M16 family metallopeptidase [Actinomycetota bacterium]